MIFNYYIDDAFSISSFAYVAQEDYAAIQEKVEFDTADTEQTVSIPVLADVLYESTETFAVRISVLCSHPGVLLGSSLATVSITDDDGKIGLLYTIANKHSHTHYYK